MFSPKPFGLHVDPNLSLSDGALGFIKSQVGILQNRLDLADQKTGRHYAYLPDGSLVTVTHVYGITRVVVSGKPKSRTTPVIPLDATFRFPTIYSGRFGTLRYNIDDPDAGVTIYLTEQCRRRFAGYDPNKVRTVARLVKDKNFNIELPELLRPKFQTPLMNESRIKIAHYQYFRPNWWSGTMASLIQLIRGYGNQPANDTRYVPLDAPLGEVNIKYETMPYRGRLKEDGVIDYRFFFDDCHGVSFDDANEPWLVHLSSDGMYVMPLPIMPETTTPEFREWCETNGDEDLIYILDTFGGLPTGESFPEQGRQYWEEVGLIQKVETLSDFGGEYSEAIGWSFNNRGHGAVNCCQTSDPNGMRKGQTHYISIDLKRIPPVDPDELPVRDGLFDMIMSVHPLSGEQRKAFLFKLRHAPYSEVKDSYEHLKTNNNSNTISAFGWDKWSQYDLGNIFNHVVVRDKIQEGYLYFNGQQGTVGRAKPQIKFPQTAPKPDTGEYGCHSFGLEPSTVDGFNPVCSTAVFSYFADDSLKLVSYFYDPRNYNPPNESDKPPCSIIGSWTTVTYSGAADLAGHWFMNDLDEREAIPATVSTTTTTSMPVGYSEPIWAFARWFYEMGTITRSFVYNTNTTNVTTESKSFDVATIVPWGFRDGCLYTSKTKSASGSMTKSTGSGSVPDPYSYVIYTHHNIFAYIKGGASGNSGNALSTKDIDPPPKDGKPITVVDYTYSPSPCSDTYSSGGWLDIGDDVTDACLNGGNFTTGGKMSGKGAARGQRSTSFSTPIMSQESGHTYFNFRDTPDIVNREIAKEEYYFISPDPLKEGAIMLRLADKNCLGVKFYAAVDEWGGYDAKDKTTNRYWGYTRMVTAGTPVCQFVGVINE